MVECSCCGRDRNTMTLPSRDDVRLCRDCVEWLAGKLGVVSTPTLPVTDLREAIGFYERAGFRVRVTRQMTMTPVTGSGSSAMTTKVCSTSMSWTSTRPRIGQAAICIVQDADTWHARMAADGLPVTPIEDQPWGMREFTLTDPSGNHVRIGRSAG